MCNSRTSVVPNSFAWKRYTLSGSISKGGCRVDSRLRLRRFILCTRHSGSTAHEGEGATSQLNLPSLTSLSVAGGDRLQLGVPHWATSVYYCK